MTVIQPATLRIGKKTPGGALGYFWEEAGQVLDVATHDAHSLIAAAHGDIYEVLEEVNAEVVKVETEVKKVVTKAPAVSANDLTDALASASVTTSKPKDK